MKKTKCELCGLEILNCNIKKHRNSKLCKDTIQSKVIQKNLQIPEDLICRFCGKECKSKMSFIQHERTCPLNKNRVCSNGMKGKTGWNKGLTKETDERVLQNALSISKNYSEGKVNLSYRYTEEYRQARSKQAKEQGFGGYRERSGRSKKYKVYDSFGKEVCLQSSYELLCSEILNELEIRWIRPKALKYDKKNYFADFYLPDYDIWLDPKNNYKAKCDEEKIQKVKNQNNVKLFVLSETQLTKEYILSLIR